MTADEKDLEIILDERSSRRDRSDALKRVLEASWKDGWDACEEEIRDLLVVR